MQPWLHGPLACCRHTSAVGEENHKIQEEKKRHHHKNYMFMHGVFTYKIRRVCMIIKYYCILEIWISAAPILTTVPSWQPSSSLSSLWFRCCTTIGAGIGHCNASKGTFRLGPRNLWWQSTWIFTVLQFGSISMWSHFHLSKPWKAKFFILCDVILLVMLQGGNLITLGSEMLNIIHTFCRDWGDWNSFHLNSKLRHRTYMYIRINCLTM